MVTIAFFGYSDSFALAYHLSDHLKALEPSVYRIVRFLSQAEILVRNVSKVVDIIGTLVGHLELIFSGNIT